MSLWIEDFSGVKALLDCLRARGVTDIVEHVARHPEVVDQAMHAIRVLDVNPATLTLLRAGSRREVTERSMEILGEDSRAGFVHELAVLWTGELDIETDGVNYALDGTPVDVLLRRNGVPGHEADWSRVVVSMVDITERKRQERRLAESEVRALAMFEHSPASLWIEDFSQVKDALDELRAQGVRDLRRHIAEHPEFVHECMRRISVVDVNQRTIEMYRAESKAELLSRLHEVLRDDMAVTFAEDLVLMWAGTPGQEAEGVNYNLRGERMDVHLHWTVLPGHEERWDRALVSVTNITARRRAEEHLRYLGTHDTLTGLFNRSYFDDEARRLIETATSRCTLVIADLNGLKQVNDALGHAAGDHLLQRAGDVLAEATDDGDLVARIGGDEFALVIPDLDDLGAVELLDRIAALVAADNARHEHPILGIALGAATVEVGGSYDAAFRRADRRMYVDKARHAATTL